MVERMWPSGGRLDADCIADIAELTGVLWEDALHNIAAPAPGRPGGGRPDWLSPDRWHDARRIADEAGGDVGCLRGALGFVEDEAFVEASHRHRCQRHPRGITERMRPPA
jgi:hypothetical protein